MASTSLAPPQPLAAPRDSRPAAHGLEYDVTIVGAGAIGCALAREFSASRPSLRICVVEQAGGPAAHQSGRNSGVVHAGFNPPTGSLKARLCVEGNRLIREYCHARNVRFRDVGTVVAALDDDEVER